MPAILFYLLKLSVSLSVVFIFYHMVLRKLTFYNWNRFYLLGYTLLSLIIPFINISPVLEKSNLETSDMISWVPSVDIQNSGVLASDEIAQNSFSGWHIATIIITGGIILFLIRLLIQLFSFRRMKRKAKPVIVSGVNIYQVDENIIPFSFGNSIFINRYLHTETELPEIIRHEFIHVKQKHSLDIIWSEILCMLNWYNPFAWLLKKSIRQNLEFIADCKVLDSGINKKEYQYLLLKVIGNNQYSIATQFNFSSLKKRIAMMNKLKSAKVNSLRFLFILPLMAIILLSFRKEISSALKSKHNFQVDNLSNSLNDTIPEAPAAPPPPPAPKWKKLPDTVKGISINNDKVTITLKNGTKEKYDLNNPEDKKAIEKKYGDILPPPPPPPPARVTNAPLEVSGVAISRLSAPVSAMGVTTSPSLAPTKVRGAVIASATDVVEVAGIASSPAPAASATSPGEAMVSGNVIIADATEDDIIGEESIVITITKNTTRQQLDEFVKQMKAKGVELRYDEIEYDNKGKLIKIACTMKSKSGKSNTVATEFEKLTILSLVHSDGRNYFKVTTE